MEMYVRENYEEEGWVTYATNRADGKSKKFRLCYWYKMKVLFGRSYIKRGYGCMLYIFSKWMILCV